MSVSVKELERGGESQVENGGDTIWCYGAGKHLGRLDDSPTPLGGGCR
jgi:hypothetical protein